MKTTFRWKSLPFAIVVSTLLVGGLVSNASATPIVLFQDDFNRPNANTVNFGWVEQQNQANDVRIRDQHLEIKDDSPLQGAATQFGISTVGLGNISFLFDLVAINGTESSAEELLVQWKRAADVSFLTLDTIDISTPTATLASLSYALPGSADNTSIDIRFLLNVNDANDQVVIDDVVVQSEVIQAPEPATIALFGFGLAGLGFARRKRSA